MTVNQIDFSQHDYQDEIDRLRHEYQFDFAGMLCHQKIMWG